MSTPVDMYMEILTGKRRSFPRGFFMYDTDNAATKEIVRFFLQDILELKTRKDILLKIRKEDFSKNKLGGLLNIQYKSSPSKAAMDAFPEMNMKPWEFHEAMNNYWRGEGAEERAIEAFRYVFLKKLKLEPHEIGENLNHEVLSREGLLGALRYAFSESLSVAGEKAFPNLLAPWDVGTHVPNKYWTREKGAKALKWVIEEKLSLTRDEICEKYSRDFFKEHNLYGMIQACFTSNIYEAIDSVYPGEFKPWEFRRVRPSYWNEDTVKEAVKWLVEERLEITPEQAKSLTKGAFVTNGLYGVVEHKKNKKVREIIEEIYGEKG